MTFSEFEEIARTYGFASNLEIVEKLKHDKEGLEWFLRHDVSKIRVDGKDYLCTSNSKYIELLDKLRVVKNKSSAVRMFSRANKLKALLKSRNPEIVRTWDLIENRKLEIKMNSLWSIPRDKLWICIDDMTKESVSKLLEKVTIEVLTRGMRNDTRTKRLGK